MNNRICIKLLAAAALTGLVIGTPAVAHSHGGGAHTSAGHGGYVAHGYGGYRGYGQGGGYGYRGYGGYARGYGGYGYRGGYGWRGGYYGWPGGYYGGWGWGGVGLGLYFASLPLYYNTFWWGGTPYYYADNNYYVYDGHVGQYRTVAPPAGLQAQQHDAASGDLIAYPKNGQTEQQQATDKYECHHWAVTQSGFDPTQGAAAAATTVKRADYRRAQAACLEGRGYSVK